jgi:uncharacterized cupin superfamily protein
MMCFLARDERARPMTGEHGIHLSSTATSDWEADPEVGGLMHLLCSSGRVEAGLSRFDQPVDPVTLTLPERETFLVLEGRAHVDVVGAPSFEVGPGDMASLPKGAVVTWTLTTPYREFWVFGAE